jgi:ribosomal protein S18 acetylase RimI-like enzyme
MAVDLLALNEGVQRPPNLIIEHVGALDTLKQWTHIALDVFGFPDSIEGPFLDILSTVGVDHALTDRLYIGWLDGVAVATAELFLGAGVAGIYWVATVPEARRQGIGAAMTLAPLLDARAMGYRVGVLHSSEMGLGVYQKIGFREYCKLGVYVWKPVTEQEG